MAQTSGGVAPLKVNLLLLLSLFDRKLLLWLNHLRHPWLDRIVPFLSDERLLYGFFAVFGLLLMQERPRKGIVVTLGAFLLVLGTDALCARVLRPRLARPRPYYVMGDLYVYKHGEFRYLDAPLPRKRGGYGLPSCHAANVSCAATVFSRAIPGLSPLFWGLALLVGYSRLYLGAHYPFDVLLGFLVGWLVGLVGSAVLERWR